ncbi:hypothetical protein B0H14DRAFT_2891190 [Mycena olivaceomarginata]|nr:hypothetical protein B0H14DRAFT_2891190 [Mycena olivaceomarginata]
MSKLAKDSAAFKSVLKRQDYTSWHSQPAPAAPAAAPTPPPAAPTETDPDFVPSLSKKKPRPKSSKNYTTQAAVLSDAALDVVWSQPADTGSGNNVNTQLVYAVDYLKGTPNPTRLEDIALLTNTPLLEDPHEYNFRNKAALLTEIQRATKSGRGIHVKALKEAWKEAPSAIEELEAEGEVMVTRTVKDGQLRMVFWNEIKPNEEAGGCRSSKDLWHGLKLPDDVELRRELAKGLGLQLTTAAQAPLRPSTKKKGKRGGAPRQRQVRITNTHLAGDIDLTRDYAPPGK